MGFGLVCLAVVVAALFVVGRKTTSSQSPATDSPAAVSFTDPTKHFSASFRDKPVEDQQNLAIAGRQIPDVLWSDTIGTNVGEIVGYATYPPDFNFDAPNAALDGAVAGEVSNSHGTLESKTFGMYQGFHSADAIILAQGGYVESRAILAGRTLFIVVATSTHNPPELFANFAASVRILSHAS